MIKNGRFGGLSCNVPKRRKDNASLVYIDSTTILNMLSSKSILKNKKTWTVERLSGLRYIILAKFEASFMGDFERIQNLPFPRVAWLVCFMAIQVLEVFFPFWELQFHLSTFQIFAVIIRHKIRETKKSKKARVCCAKPPYRQGVTHYEKE